MVLIIVTLIIGVTLVLGVNINITIHTTNSEQVVKEEPEEILRETTEEQLPVTSLDQAITAINEIMGGYEDETE